MFSPQLWVDSLPTSLCAQTVRGFFFLYIWPDPHTGQPPGRPSRRNGPDYVCCSWVLRQARRGFQEKAITARWARWRVLPAAFRAKRAPSIGLDRVLADPASSSCRNWRPGAASGAMSRAVAACGTVSAYPSSSSSMHVCWAPLYFPAGVPCTLPPLSVSLLLSEPDACEIGHRCFFRSRDRCTKHVGW